MASYYVVIPGAPRRSFEPQLVGGREKVRGPVVTAAVNVPALALLLVGVIVLCIVMLLNTLARSAMRIGHAWHHSYLAEANRA